MSQQPDAAYIQEVPLDGVTGVEIQAARLDLIVESDQSIEGVAQLLADSAEGAPQLSLRGTNLRLNQDERYHGAAAPVLRLPAAGLEGLAANLSRGSLRLENLPLNVAVNLDSGRLTISGGSGNAAVNISSGEALVQDRDGNLACRIDSGLLSLARCRGELVVTVSKGDINARECGGSLHLKVDKGDINLIQPAEQHIGVQATRSDVSIRGGSLIGAEVDVVRGDISSSARLLFTGPPEPPEPPEPPDEIGEMMDFEDVIEDVVESVTDEVRFNLGGVEFVAGEDGVRISTGGTDLFQANEDGVRIRSGGTDLFRAGPHGVVIRRRDGTPIFVADEQGIGTPSGRRGKEQFRFATGRGSISLDIPDDQPARVELIVNRGTATSDIPLVEVGRPGPRSSTRRYVGVSDSSETDRILIRARTNRGDVRVRTVEAARESSRDRPTRNRERQRRAILEALARGDLTPDEADILLAAMERENR